MTTQARRILQAELAHPALADRTVRMQFCLACIERVAHLLERDDARDALAQWRAQLAGPGDSAALSALAARASAIARNHGGSGSIDGAGHAAVSATHALARAIAGDAPGTADYAAYAATYAYGGYAIQDPAACDAEYAAQLQMLRAMG